MPLIRSHLSQAVRITFAIAVGLASVFIFYRQELLNGLTWLFGDVLDTRIAITIQEHWYNVFRGREFWQDPTYFFPTKDALGYNDVYFLYGIIYAVYRLFGADPFIANEGVGATIRLIGYAGFFLFATRVCRLPFLWAVVGAATFTLSNSAYLQSIHMQLFTVVLAPWLGLFGWMTWKSLDSRNNQATLCWSSLAATLSVTWLMTSFYTIWFTGLFTLILLICAWLIFCPPLISNCSRTKLSDIAPLVPAAMILIGGLTAFVATYLPKARETGMHSYGDTFMPSALDMMHIGTGNVLFGWLDDMITASVRPGFPDLSEHTVGFPPLLLILFLGGAILPWMQPRSTENAWWRAAGAATLISLLLCLRVGQHSLWWLIFISIPGAGAVRGVVRFLLLLAFPAILLATSLLSRFSPKLPKLVMIILAALLIAEEVNSGASIKMDRPEELAMLRAVPTPPIGCQQFFISKARILTNVGDNPVINQLSINVDGMMLSELIGLPTFNGHASFIPADFGFSFHDQKQYTIDSRAALLTGSLENGTCGLDLQDMRWTENPVTLSRLTQNTFVRVGGEDQNGANYLLTGWSGIESLGRWTDGPTADIAFLVDPGQRDLLLQLQAGGFANSAGKTSSVDVSVNGRRVATWTPAVPPQILSARIPADAISSGGAVLVKLTIVRPASPSDVGISADPRKLGLFLEWFRISQAPT